MADCPADTDLSSFLNEAMPPDGLARLAEHVDSCTGCQERLERLTRENDNPISRFKDLSAVLPSLGDPRVGFASDLSTANTLVLGSNTPLLIPHISGLPRVPGFDLITEIGRGGMGVVYKARHRGLNRLVALKMILAGGAADTKTVQRFLFEAEILARIQHPQVVQVFEVDTYQAASGVPIPYLAIELLEGGSLSQRLKKGPLDALAAAELVEGIARAVHAAHAQGVIHRDLKPGNILFPGNDEIRNSKSDIKAEAARPEVSPNVGSSSNFELRISNFGPKVTDFGLAKFTEAGADLTGSGQVVGTPHYMAPEQAAGIKQIGPTADVYALGAILFECLTGRPPFQGVEPMSVLVKVVSELPPDVRALRPDVPRDLGAVVMRCLEKTARRRYATAEELANDLRRFLENRPTRARPVPARERVLLWVKRNPAIAGLLAALLGVLSIGLVSVTWLWIEARQTAKEARDAETLAKIAENRATRANTETKSALTQAKQSEGEALDAQKRATEALAHLEFARAMVWCEEGRVREGLELFVRAVELAEATGATELARVARANLAAWPRELPPARRAFTHSHQPRLAAFHPDGKHMVTAGRDSAAFLWNTTTGEKVRTYKPAKPRHLYIFTGVTFWSVAISPDGKTIAAGSSDGYITIWNTDSPEPRYNFDATGFDDNLWTVAFAPGGTLWASDGHSGLKRWNVAGPKPVLVARAAPPTGAWAGSIHVIAVSANGTRVYSGDRTGMIREWDAEKNVELRNWDAGGWVQDLALSPDGTRVAATGPEGIARIIDLTTNKVALDINLGSAYGNGIAFAPKTPYVLTSDGDGNVRTWHRDTGMMIGVPFRLSGEVTKIRFRPDSEEFAVPAGNSVFLCKVPDPPGDVVSAGYGSRLRGLDVSPKGDWLAVSDDFGFELFDPFTAKRLQRVDYTLCWPYYRRQDPPLTIRFDPDPTRPRVFRGTRNGFDRLAVPDGLRAQAIPSFRLGRVNRIEFMRNGTGILVADNNVVTRWNANDLRQLPAARLVDDLPAGVDVKSLAIRPDGGEVMLGFANKVVFLNPDSLEPSRKGWTTGDEILDAKYTPDGKKLLLGRRDNMAELRDAATGELLARAMPHGRAVVAVAVSPDGNVLLTGSRDGTARFWDATTGLPLGAPLRHLGPVTHVVYSPNGDHAFTGTGTGHVLVWDTPPPPATGTLDELRAAIKKPKD